MTYLELKREVPKLVVVTIFWRFPTISSEPKIESEVRYKENTPEKEKEQRGWSILDKGVSK